MRIRYPRTHGGVLWGYLVFQHTAGILRVPYPQDTLGIPGHRWYPQDILGVSQDTAYPQDTDGILGIPRYPQDTDRVRETDAEDTNSSLYCIASFLRSV